MVNIIVTNKIWIPTSLTNKGQPLEQLKDIDYLKGLTTNLFDETACSACIYRNRKPCRCCFKCKGFKKRLQLYGTKSMFFEENPNEDEYFYLPIGCLKDVKRLLAG